MERVQAYEPKREYRGHCSRCNSELVVIVILTPNNKLIEFCTQCIEQFPKMKIALDK